MSSKQCQDLNIPCGKCTIGGGSWQNYCPVHGKDKPPGSPDKNGCFAGEVFCEGVQINGFPGQCIQTDLFLDGITGENTRNAVLGGACGALQLYSGKREPR